MASLFATAQPVLVKDIYIGSNGSNIQNFLSYSNNLAFSARDSTGTYWYQSNGTTAGTTQITQLSSLHAVSFKAFGYQRIIGPGYGVGPVERHEALRKVYG